MLGLCVVLAFAAAYSVILERVLGSTWRMTGAETLRRVVINAALYGVIQAAVHLARSIG